jgi:hypothetical protein
MTRKIFLLSILVFIFSCSNRQDNHKKNILVDTSNVINCKNKIDSLDLDTIDFITTNFPDTIRNILYGTSDSLLSYIKKSSILNNKKQNVLLSDTLSKILNQNGFQIDNSQREIVANKKLFNKRELISWFSSKSDTITTQVIYWHLGKKYILIEQRWNE